MAAMMRETSDLPQKQLLEVDSRPHFFRVLLPTNLQDPQMPRKFVRIFRRELSDVALLKGPSGRVCRVGLEVTDDGIVHFSNGWEEFIKHNSLCIGYFLVFRYDGRSQFNVKVFDESTCEKEYPCASRNDDERSRSNKQSCTPEKDSDDSIEILGVSKVKSRHLQPTENERNGTYRALRSSERLRSNNKSKVTEMKNLGKRKNSSEEQSQSETRRSKSEKANGIENNQQETTSQDHLLPLGQSDCIKSVQSNGKKSIESIHKNTSKCFNSVDLEKVTKRQCSKIEKAVESENNRQGKPKDYQLPLRRSIRNMSNQSNDKGLMEWTRKTLSESSPIDLEELLSLSESRCSESEKAVGSKNIQQQSKSHDHLLPPRRSSRIKFIQSNQKGSTESIHKNISSCLEEDDSSEATPTHLEKHVSQSQIEQTEYEKAVGTESNQQQARPKANPSSQHTLDHIKSDRKGLMESNCSKEKTPAEVEQAPINLENQSSEFSTPLINLESRRTTQPYNCLEEDNSSDATPTRLEKHASQSQIEQTKSEKAVGTESNQQQARPEDNPSSQHTLDHIKSDRKGLMESNCSKEKTPAEGEQTTINLEIQSGELSTPSINLESQRTQPYNCFEEDNSSDATPTHLEKHVSQSQIEQTESEKAVGTESNQQQARPEDNPSSQHTLDHIKSDRKGLMESNCSKEKAPAEVEQTPINLENQSSELSTPSIKLESQRTQPFHNSSTSESLHNEEAEENKNVMSDNERVRSRFVPQKRSVATEEKRKALREARKFKSNNPYFVAVIKPSCVLNYSAVMSIPYNFVKDHFSSRPLCVTLELSDGRNWTVGCRYTQISSLLSKGWSQFISENNIVEGDVCVFELVNRNKSAFKVFIYRVREVVVSDPPFSENGNEEVQM